MYFTANHNHRQQNNILIKIYIEQVEGTNIVAVNISYITD